MSPIVVLRTRRAFYSGVSANYCKTVPTK